MNEAIGFLLLLLENAARYAGSLVDFLMFELNSIEIKAEIIKLLRLLM